MSGAGYVYRTQQQLRHRQQCVFRQSHTVSSDGINWVKEEARQFNAREYRILASQQVIDLFLEEESQALAQLSDFIAKPISMQVETLYSQEQYDVILM